ncbi:MAG: hypothetical protein KatS3mg093_342 [Candidatus Parcubacteria bacterium]|nr:MAG: hypothetical protein KatS3mg001_305 [Candidatus Pacearchaeota archaeon]GIW65363.1 MAG: hypothetical protein KatS3mg093_342 [Candidatus Parcubacteria bacterium]
MGAKTKKIDLWSEKILYLKKSKEFFSKLSYKGINLWPIMAGDIYTYYYFSHIDIEEEPSFFKRFLINIKSLFFEDKFPVKGNGRILVSYFMPRKDHHELVKRAVSKFPKKDLVWIDAFGYKQKNILFRGKIKFPNILLLLSIYNKFRKKKLKKIFRNYYWFYILKTYFRLKQINQFYDIVDKIKPKGYIAFCSSAFPEEAILTLICKNKKIPTFTLQHGFFYKPKSFVSSIIQSENIISDYHLLWGKKSYNIQKEYTDESRLIIVGNPKYELIKKKVKKEYDPKKATIFFSVPAYNEGNFRLREIVKKFIEDHPEIIFNIAVHPMNDMNLFSKYFNYKNVKFISKNILAQDLLKESDFVIVYNTTAALEALNYKIPILRYAGKDFLSFWDKKQDTFTNLNELRHLFLKIKNKRNYKKLMDFYEKELKKTFYFHPKKTIPEVYYKKIMEKIKNK